jgi:hypothetical protein
MATDFQKKEPSKNERMIFELAMNQQHIERSLWSTSAHIVALGVLLGADPEKVAELLVNGDDKVKEYSKKVNDKIQELEKAKQPADKVEPTIDTEAPAESHEGHDHE